MVRIALCLGCAALLATACYGEDPGTVVAIVHGTGTMKTDAFALNQGAYRVEEIAQPARCITQITVLDDSGNTLTTISPAGPPPSSPAPNTEDTTWTGNDVDAAMGNYHAEGKAPNGCFWTLRVTTPPA